MQFYLMLQQLQSQLCGSIFHYFWQVVETAEGFVHDRASLCE